jgi:hypothetical protein
MCRSSTMVTVVSVAALVLSAVTVSAACFVDDGTVSCCVPFSIGCRAGSTVWMCAQSVTPPPGGGATGCSVGQVVVAPYGVSGKTGILSIPACSCTISSASCGAANSCVPGTPFVNVCVNSSATGEWCVGDDDGER